MTFEQIKQSHDDFMMHTYGRVPVALVKGKNATAWDESGKKYIDFTAGIAVNTLGYSDDGWVKAVSAQAAEIQHISNYYYSPVNIRLAEKLAQVSGLKRSFFCNSGAEANECAIKVAKKYGEGRSAYQIITFEDSFHGRTHTTLAATGQDAFHKDFLPLTDGFLYAKRNMESVRETVTGQVCAVMLEMVQGEGGVIPMDEDFVRELRAFCDEQDLLLIADEVQAGIGRTGDFFGYQTYGILPDVTTFAKGIAGGLPMGVCMVSEKLQDLMQPGMNGSTFGGNPVASAGALEVLERLSEDGFLDTVRKKAAVFKEALTAMPQVEFVRGKGLLLGFKVKNQDAHAVMAACAEAGLLVLTAKDLVRLLPPLTISDTEIQEGLAILKEVIAKGETV